MSHEHNKLGELDRAICGQCDEPWWQCSICHVYFCDCSRGRYQ